MGNWGSRPPLERGTFEGANVPAQCNVPTREYVPHCWPAAAGECACSAHAAQMNVFEAVRGN